MFDRYDRENEHKRIKNNVAMNAWLPQASYYYCFMNLFSKNPFLKSFSPSVGHLKLHHWISCENSPWAMEPCLRELDPTIPRWGYSVESSQRLPLVLDPGFYSWHYYCAYHHNPFYNNNLEQAGEDTRQMLPEEKTIEFKRLHTTCVSKNYYAQPTPLSAFLPRSKQDPRRKNQCIMHAILSSIHGDPN